MSAQNITQGSDNITQGSQDIVGQESDNISQGSQDIKYKIGIKIETFDDLFKIIIKIFSMYHKYKLDHRNIWASYKELFDKGNLRIALWKKLDPIMVNQILNLPFKNQDGSLIKLNCHLQHIVGYPSLKEPTLTNIMFVAANIGSYQGSTNKATPIGSLSELVVHQYTLLPITNIFMNSDDLTKLKKMIFYDLQNFIKFINEINYNKLLK